eukprot:Nk52_evm43s252 gene=Nk52_evmTU43s252
MGKEEENGMPGKRTGLASRHSLSVKGLLLVLTLGFVLLDLKYHMSFSSHDRSKVRVEQPKVEEGGAGGEEVAKMGVKVDQKGFKYRCPGDGSIGVTDHAVLSAIERAQTSKCKGLFIKVHCRTIRNETMGVWKISGDENFSLASVYQPHTFMDNDKHFVIARPKDPAEMESIHSSPWPDNEYYRLLCPRDTEEVMDLFAKKSFAPENSYFACQRRPKILYVLLVTTVTERIFLRLLNALDDPENLFVVHVDVKYEDTFKKLEAFIALAERSKMLQSRVLKLSQKRFNVYWGGYSFILAMNWAISEVIDMEWDYAINLSLSDYPLFPQGDIKGMLRRHPQANFMASGERFKNMLLGELSSNHDLGCLFDNSRICVKESKAITIQKKFLYDQGFFNNFIECENRMWNAGARTLPAGAVYQGGSDWFIFSKTFSKYLVRNLLSNDKLLGNDYESGAEVDDVAMVHSDPYLNGFHRMFRYSLHAAESFFHSVLLNHPYFRSTFVNNNYRFISWRRKNCNCKDREQFADWCSCSPTFINNMDIANVTSFIGRLKNNRYFARKFHPDASQNILNSIDDISFGRRHIKFSDYHWLTEKNLTAEVKGNASLVASMLSSSKQRLRERGVDCNDLSLKQLTRVLKFDRFYGFSGLLECTLFSGGNAIDLNVMYSPKYKYALDIEEMQKKDQEILLRHVEVGASFDGQFSRFNDVILCSGNTPTFLMFFRRVVDYEEGKSTTLNINYTLKNSEEKEELSSVMNITFAEKSNNRRIVANMDEFFSNSTLGPVNSGAYTLNLKSEYFDHNLKFWFYSFDNEKESEKLKSFESQFEFQDHCIQGEVELSRTASKDSKLCSSVEWSNHMGHWL